MIMPIFGQIFDIRPCLASHDCQSQDVMSSQPAFPYCTLSFIGDEKYVDGNAVTGVSRQFHSRNTRRCSC